MDRGQRHGGGGIGPETRIVCCAIEPVQRCPQGGLIVGVETPHGRLDFTIHMGHCPAQAKAATAGLVAVALFDGLARVSRGTRGCRYGAKRAASQGDFGTEVGLPRKSSISSARTWMIWLMWRRS